MNHPDKNKFNVDSLGENHRQFIINNKLILKSLHSKDVEGRNILHLRKELTILHWVLTMIKEYNQ